MRNITYAIYYKLSVKFCETHLFIANKSQMELQQNLSQHQLM